MRQKDAQHVVNVLSHSLLHAPPSDVDGLITAIGSIISDVKHNHPHIDAQALLDSLPDLPVDDDDKKIGIQFLIKFF